MTTKTATKPASNVDDKTKTKAKEEDKTKEQSTLALKNS